MSNLSTQQFGAQYTGKHRSDFIVVGRTTRGGEDKPANDKSVRLAPNLDVPKKMVKK